MFAADVRSEKGSSDGKPPHKPTGEKIAANGAAVLAEESEDADEDDQDEVEDDSHIVPEDEPVESGIYYGRRISINFITIQPCAGLDRCHRLADRELKSDTRRDGAALSIFNAYYGKRSKKKKNGRV